MSGEDADRRVLDYVTRLLRSGGDGHLFESITSDVALEHLRACDSTVVEHADAEAVRFWDTAVTGAEFEAHLTCGHGVSTDWSWGELGDLPDILTALDHL